LGVGVASVRGGQGRDDSFGLVGLSAVGPILAVLVLGMFAQPDAAAAVEETAIAEHVGLVEHFLSYLPSVATDVGMALGPLAVMFLIFRLFLLRLTTYQTVRLVMGLIYTYLGLVLFFLGVYGGFISAGHELGALIAQHDFRYLLVVAGVAIGGLVVCAEPTVWILNAQVEEVSGGYIRKSIMLFSLATGVSVAVGLAMLRVITGLSIWWFILPGYALALGLTRFCPRMFVAIAFDSGGVASGPVAATFILSLTLGASQALGGNPITDAFGIIAMISMTPLITIQLLGMLFEKREQAALRKREMRRNAGKKPSQQSDNGDSSV
jgi:hypothetical protein